MDYSAVKGVTVPAFLWRVHVQSGFKEGNRRMQCDHRPGIRQPVSDDSAASRQSRRILEAPDSAQLTQTSALTGFRPVPKVRMSSSLRHAVWTAEKFRRPSPPKYEKYAHFSRLFLGKPDRRERTARDQIKVTDLWLFSGRHIRSPVSSSGLGEYNAIRSRGFRPQRVDLCGHLRTDFGVSHQPVSGQLPSQRPIRLGQRVKWRFSPTTVPRFHGVSTIAHAAVANLVHWCSPPSSLCLQLCETSACRQMSCAAGDSAT